MSYNILIFCVLLSLYLQCNSVYIQKLCITSMQSNTWNSKANIEIKMRESVNKKTENDINLKFLSIVSAISGSFSCCVTHSLLLPLDVIKTRMQTDFAFRKLNFVQVAIEIVRGNGVLALFDGLTATSVGYALQGGIKFGFFEYFKSKLNSHHSVDQTKNQSYLSTLLISSALAETIACLALCPLETTKIFLVTHSGKYRNVGLISVMNIIIHSEGFWGLYKGIQYVLLRQVPYTVAKLTAYEKISERFYNMKNKMNVNIKNFDLMIQMTSGVYAGVIAALISHPADVLLSRLCCSDVVECATDPVFSKVINTVRCLGFKGCYTGVVPRAVMIGSLAALQFVLYENVKKALKSSIELTNNEYNIQTL